MQLDPLFIPAMAVVCALTALGLLFRAAHLTASVGYIVAGLLLGPSLLGVVTDQEDAARLGAIGVVLLLFFAGMEISPREFVERWRVAILGTTLQILATIAMVFVIGHFLDWPVARSLVIGFALSNSSTIIVIDLLEKKNLLQTDMGKNALLILLAQDIAVIPMLMLVGWIDPETGSGEYGELLWQMAGAALLLTLLAAAWRRRPIRLPFARLVSGDAETQVLVSIILCFGLALVAGLFSLSTALGAFIAGLIARYFSDIDWVGNRLHSFQAVFLAIFFFSIGLLVDFPFMLANIASICGLTMFALIANTVLNAFVLRLVGLSWSQSFVTASLLAQIGEFSFVIATLGSAAGVIGHFGYQVTIVVIALTMILSPAWIAMVRLLFRSP